MVQLPLKGSGTIYSSAAGGLGSGEFALSEGPEGVMFEETCVADEAALDGCGNEP